MGDLMDKDPRKIEKRRSWTEISESASAGHEPLDEDYATELDLFERGEIDQSLWAKHLVETKGDKEEAKWLYVKERVATQSARRAEQERVKAQEEERRRRLAEQKAAEEEQKRRERESQIQKSAAMSRTSTLLKIYEQRKERALGTLVMVVVGFPLGVSAFIEAEKNDFNSSLGFWGFMLVLVASLCLVLFPIFLALTLASRVRLKKALRDLGYLS